MPSLAIQGEFNFLYKAVLSLFQGHQEAKEEHEGEEEKVDILQLFAKAQERYDNEVSDWWVYFSFSLQHNYLTLTHGQISSDVDLVLTASLS